MPFQRKLDVLDTAAVHSFMSVLDARELDAIADAFPPADAPERSWLREAIVAEQKRRRASSARATRSSEHRAAL